MSTQQTSGIATQQNSQLQNSDSTLDLKALFAKTFGTECESIEMLPISGSNRIYYRLHGNDQSVIGTVNEDLQENNTFISFAKHFKAKGLSVPNILASDQDHGIYLQEDLGNNSLFQKLLSVRAEGKSANTLMADYQKAVEALGIFQTTGAEDLDWSLCFPRENFDRQSMQWDLNYFKYYFLKPSNTAFDEEKLEQDFSKLSGWLEKAENNFFMYRDFQSRNIMLNNEKLFFIDFQGGRKGPLQYDLVSLLFQAKADLPEEMRSELLNHYLQAMEKIRAEFDREKFLKYYSEFILLRCLQVLGAYGFRGYFEGKSHFLSSVPYALKNAQWLLEKADFSIWLPEIQRILKALCANPNLAFHNKPSSKYLTVSIQSFSYKRGLPEDNSGNGGGFIFDCRGLHNPGRYEPYKALTGKDKSVKQFLESESKIEAFLRNVYGMIEPAVENYIEREFTHLQINFGCTGGQHRSVYCTEALEKHLQSKYEVRVEKAHRETAYWPENNPEKS